MNRKFDIEHFQVLAGIIKESTLFEQGAYGDPDYSTLHHMKAAEDFEEQERRSMEETGSGIFRIKVSVPMGSSVKDDVADILGASETYSSIMGWFEEGNDFYVGEFIDFNEAEDELNEMYNLFKSNGIHSVQLEVSED